MRFRFERSFSSERDTEHYRAFKDDQPLRFEDALSLWAAEASAFRSSFFTALTSSTFRAFRWETPYLSLHSLDRPFEFVLLDAPFLEVPADPSAFASYFEGAPGDSVVSFENLGGDALLVVPCPLEETGAGSAYAHLGAFLRHASNQAHILWRRLGNEALKRVKERPFWLNTAGGGVPWLHIRLDDRPKYYGHRPYRDRMWGR